MACGTSAHIRWLGASLVTFAALLVVASGPAAPAAVDLHLGIGAATAVPQNAPITPSGGTVTVTSLRFWVVLDVSLITPTAGKAKVRAELGEGLRWGDDEPDPSEQCTSTPTTGECETAELLPITGRTTSGWYWQVVAAQPGTYTYRAEIVEATDTDPDPSNNSSSITIVVTDTSGGGGAGGAGGGSGGGSAAVSAGAAQLKPAKPRAGRVVTATVRVTADGSPVRPGRVACTGSISGAKVRGAPRAGSGTAACAFRTPASARGKLLRGSIAFTARGQRFVKRFSVRLR